ncbi:lipopolysaccharide biosynthesis protein [Pontibacter russatus]|uniref:lipopolysaccharide biosynthesis protein n=1 Tax=Pontibacter russatus TaxID=2694929 RepID=UPI00137AC539|nr:polysaccharide biosynthesis C-terminal domain-containing protein [Pontibacter russatus]
MSIAKKLVGQTAAYGLSSIVGRALNYLLVPIYTAVLATEEFGVMSYLYAGVGFFNILYTYGMETAFFRFANKTGADRNKLYNQVLSLIICSSLLFTTVLILASGAIASYIGFPEQREYVVWLAVILAVDAIVAIPFARLRLLNKALKFATVKLANILLTVGANMFFLVLCRAIYNGDYLQELQPLVAYIYDPAFGIGYIFLINLVANALIIPMLWKEFASFRFELNMELLRPMLVYAYPLLFMGLAGAVNELLDRILLQEWLPAGFYPGKSNFDAIGIYSACYKLAIFMTLAIQAFRYAAEPFFFSQAEEKDSAHSFALIMKWFVIVCAFIFLFISANLEDFAFLFLRGEDYREGIMVVPVLLLANLFLGVYYNLSVWFKLTDKTKFGTYISFGGAAITIIFNLLLIPVLGYMGSAIATLVCYFSMALVSYLLGNRHYPIPYPVKTIVGYILLAAGLVWLALGVEVENFWLRHLYHLAICAAFAVVVWLRERPRFLKF